MTEESTSLATGQDASKVSHLSIQGLSALSSIECLVVVKEVRKASLELDSQVLCCSLQTGLIGTVLSLGNPVEVLGAGFQ